MSDDTKTLLGGVLLLIAVGFLFLGGAIGYAISQESMQTEAVKRGYAYHEPTQGRWQWKEQAK